PKPFAEAEIKASKTVAAKDVAIASFTREVGSEIVELNGGSDIRGAKKVDRTVRILNCTVCFHRSNVSGETGEFRVRRPLSAITDANWDPAGPPGQAGELPSTDQRVERTVRVLSKPTTTTEGQIHNPVGVKLMRQVKVRDRA